MGHSLQNKVLISTRPLGQNTELKELFEKEGAVLLEMPTIKIESAQLKGSEKAILKELRQFTWIVFTSPNGIHFFFKQIKMINGNYRLPSSVKLAVVGTKSKSVLLSYGYETCIDNSGNTGLELANELLPAINNSDHILFPEGNIARGTIAKILSQKAKCTSLVVYNNQQPESINTDILNKIIENNYDYIIVTSPSGIKHLLKLLPPEFKPKQLRLISIGTTTSDEALSLGIVPLSTAKMSNAFGIFEAIRQIEKV